MVFKVLCDLVPAHPAGLRLLSILPGTGTSSSCHCAFAQAVPFAWSALTTALCREDSFSCPEVQCCCCPIQEALYSHHQLLLLCPLYPFLSAISHKTQLLFWFPWTRLISLFPGPLEHSTLCPIAACTQQPLLNDRKNLQV